MKPPALTLLCPALMAVTSNLVFGVDYNELLHDIYQSNADQFDRYQVTPTNSYNDEYWNYIFNIKEDVTFRDYENNDTWVGNIFTFNQTSSGFKKLNTVIGEGNDSFDLVFENNRSVYAGSVDEFASKEGGAARFANVVFQDLKSVQFLNNTLDNQKTTTEAYQAFAFGGGMSAFKVSIDNVADFIVQGNTAVAEESIYGGGVQASKLTTGQLLEGSTNQFVEGSGTGNIAFLNNKIVIRNVGHSGSGAGYGNNEGSSTASDHFQNTGAIKFNGNSIVFADSVGEGDGSRVGMYGGAVYSTNNYFTNTLNIEFTDNYVDASTQDYMSWAAGGAISSLSTMFQGVRKANGSEYALLVSNNRALTNFVEGSTGHGGAISASRVWVYESEDALFSNNYATTKGGAIYLKKYSSTSLSSCFYADLGDVTFRGNTDSLTDNSKRESGVANAIHVQETNDGYSTSIYLQAQQGREVNFYDPITADTTTSDKLNIYINTSAVEPERTGIVRFSGKYVTDTLAGSEQSADYAERVEKSKQSNVNANIVLGNGTLILEEGVTLGRKYDASRAEDGAGAVVKLRGGTLDIQGSAVNGDTTLSGSTITFEAAGEGLESNAILKAGAQAYFDANTVNIDNGVRIDMSYYFSGQQAIEHHGLGITAETLTLGGSIFLYDNNSNFYRTEDWLNDMEFVLFNITDVDSVSGSFGDIQTESSGSNAITAATLYQGEWSIVQDNNQIIAKWTSYQILPVPEPSVAIMGLVGMGGLLLRRRKPA